MPGWWNRYRRRVRLRARRQYLLARAIRRRRALSPVADRTGDIGADAILCFVTLRNEAVRLPYFLDYYRKLGIDPNKILYTPQGRPTHVVSDARPIAELM